MLAPTVLILQKRRVARGYWGTIRLAIQMSERANPLPERVRLGCLRYAEAGGGARLGEKENDGAEYDMKSKVSNGVSRRR